MNSKELEKSLKNEFNNHLESLVSVMKQELSDLKNNVDAEFLKNKTRIDEMFQEFTSKLESDRTSGSGFEEMIVEHIRLARDEGARITAEAITEAEKMREENAPDADFTKMRDAISDISGKHSQSEILKSLLHHAANYAPRGALFIVKNAHLVGWRIFGSGEGGEQTLHEIFFPVASQTIPGEAIRSMKTVDNSFGQFDDEAIYLNRLGFGVPDRMYAIPLVVRDRGVAVMYADYGREGTRVDVGALETLMNVAALTVELLAASRGTKNHQTVKPDASYSPQIDAKKYGNVSDPAQNYQKEQSGFTSERIPGLKTETENSADWRQFEAQQFNDSPIWSKKSEPADPYKNNFSNQESFTDPQSFEQTDAFSNPDLENNFSQSVSQQFSSFESYFDSQNSSAKEENQHSEKNESWENSQSDNFRTEKNDFESESFQAEQTNTNQFENFTAESSNVGRRGGERSVDLPIDINEDEQYEHDKAQRFARLLVSEIKLYNEQKVSEGREWHDLYERLREAIDRSREMYDKRVEPPVASRFDYFHHELVKTLAQGDESKLGTNYPGAAV